MKKLALLVTLLITLTGCIMGPEIIKKYDPDYDITYYKPTLSKFHSYFYIEEHFNGQLIKFRLAVKNSEEYEDIKYSQVEFYGEDTYNSIFLKTNPKDHKTVIEYEYVDSLTKKVYAEYSSFILDFDQLKSFVKMLKKNDSITLKVYGKEKREYELEYDEIKKMKLIVDQYFSMTTGVKIFYKNKKDNIN